jgi:hypothetical protein
MSTEASETSLSVFIDDLDPTKPVGASDSIYEAANHARMTKRIVVNSFPAVTGAVAASHLGLNAADGLTANVHDGRNRLPCQNIIHNGDFASTYYVSDVSPANGGQTGAVGWRMKVENTATARFYCFFDTVSAATGLPRVIHNAGRFYSGVSMTSPGTELHSLYQRLPERVLRMTAGQTLTLITYCYTLDAWTCAPKLVQHFGSGGVPSGDVEIAANTAAEVYTINTWERRSWTFNVPAVSGKTFGTTANTAYLELRIPLHNAGVTLSTRSRYLTGIRLLAGAPTWVEAEYEEEDPGLARAAACEIEYYHPSHRMRCGMLSTTAYQHEPIAFPGRFHKTPTCDTIRDSWLAWGAYLYPDADAAEVTVDGALIGGTRSATTVDRLGYVSTTNAGFLFSAFPGE